MVAESVNFWKYPDLELLQIGTSEIKLFHTIVTCSLSPKRTIHPNYPPYLMNNKSVESLSVLHHCFITFTL